MTPDQSPIFTSVASRTRGRGMCRERRGDRLPRLLMSDTYSTHRLASLTMSGGIQVLFFLLCFPTPIIVIPLCSTLTLCLPYPHLNPPHPSHNRQSQFLQTPICGSTYYNLGTILVILMFMYVTDFGDMSEDAAAGLKSVLMRRSSALGEFMPTSCEHV